jgi:hypothetical protein
VNSTRLAAASDKVYQLLAHGRWFSPGTPASSNTKTGRHDIAEILLKVGLSTKKHKILLFHKMVNKTVPEYVSNLVPSSFGRTNKTNIITETKT